MDLSKLPMNTFNEIPEPNENAEQIVAIKKENGKITGYKLSDGRIINKDEGVLMAKQGGIRGVGVSERKGEEYLKSLPDETEDNNLSNLPKVED
ncbi:MAG: DUF3892 domain-containing protein [Oscillospiraceae bacterium]|nr:DUF3892 domain-containing protein [Oscillospiraceae bacterium]